MTPRIMLAATAALAAITASAASINIDVDCAKPAVELSPHLYGLFFEDINFAADGGLYAELVQNRSFEYYAVRADDPLASKYHPLYAWNKVERGGTCDWSVEDDQPLNKNNTKHLKLAISSAGSAVGISNDGFDGIPVDSGAKYIVSLYARQSGWSGDSSITVAIELPDGTVCGQTRLSGLGTDWKKLEGVIQSSKTANNAKLLVTVAGKGTLYLDMVSLFPQDTFAGRKNGMRKDLAQALKDLNPKFLRFPGGCVLHGASLDNIYRWKDTVGDLAERKPNWNRWGYHQSYGLGYFEYFQLCEDIGATALPVIPVGVSCGFTPPQQAAPMDEMGPWIQDALDLIEFANGPTTSTWGALRAKMGHPAPFNLKFVALGNEPHDNALFRDRFPLFVDAIREAYPEIKIIGTSGLGAGIPIYDLMTEEEVYSSDEHYYDSPTWFLSNTHRFDDFDRSKPKIFVGEYASQDQRLYNAIAEAAYLTGIERNADIVDMTCYAPLFGNVLHSQWNPDLIYFDHRTVVKTPSYYVQQLFAANKGDVYLANSISATSESKKPTISGAVGVGTWQTAIEVEDVKVNGKPVDTSKWTARGGNFEIGDRIVQKDDNAQGVICASPDQYSGETVTYTLRARKTSGREGFLIQFGTQRGQEDFWWNIGGWGNTRHAIQSGSGTSRGELTTRNGSIETGKWYDVKVVLSPGNIKCYLDNALVHDYDIPTPTPFLSATRDKAAGEVILKLVNPQPEAIEATINLKGTRQVASEGKLVLLTGDRRDMNSIEDPENVKTETSSIKTGKQFAYTMPPMSVQFIRIKAE